jgi:predicted DNA-binding protein (MmcQ/YjbR family)
MAQAPKNSRGGNKSGLPKAEQAIAQWAAGYPEVVEEAPWGHRAFKVRNKTFLFLGCDADELGFSVKLPQSGLEVLGLPFAEPTGYGLGKSGWVSFKFGPKDSVPLELIEEWLRESFVAIAPKKLSATLESDSAPPLKPRAAKASATLPGTKAVPKTAKPAKSAKAAKSAKSAKAASSKPKRARAAKAAPSAASVKGKKASRK